MLRAAAERATGGHAGGLVVLEADPAAEHVGGCRRGTGDGGITIEHRFAVDRQRAVERDAAIGGNGRGAAAGQCRLQRVRLGVVVDLRAIGKAQHV